jgi:hypothetical protein
MLLNYEKTSLVALVASGTLTQISKKTTNTHHPEKHRQDKGLNEMTPN